MRAGGERLGMAVRIVEADYSAEAGARAARRLLVTVGRAVRDVLAGAPSRQYAGPPIRILRRGSTGPAPVEVDPRRILA